MSCSCQPLKDTCYELRWITCGVTALGCTTGLGTGICYAVSEGAACGPACIGILQTMSGSLGGTCTLYACALWGANGNRPCCIKIDPQQQAVANAAQAAFVGLGCRLGDVEGTLTPAAVPLALAPPPAANAVYHEAVDQDYQGAAPTPPPVAMAEEAPGGIPAALLRALCPPENAPALERA